MAPHPHCPSAIMLVAGTSHHGHTCPHGFPPPVLGHMIQPWISSQTFKKKTLLKSLEWVNHRYISLQRSLILHTRDPYVNWTRSIKVSWKIQSWLMWGKRQALLAKLTCILFLGTSLEPAHMPSRCSWSSEMWQLAASHPVKVQHADGPPGAYTHPLWCTVTSRALQRVFYFLTMFVTDAWLHSQQLASTTPPT